ncbi:hypothetical protein EON83_20345 [bacterium]|nr:MAG: hypothetical protein EON83_20345 [bacterium]
MNQETQPLEIPSAPAAETTYLAALLAGQLDSELLTLDPNEFAQERHELIYGAAAKRLLNGEPLAPSLLIEDLSNAGDLALVGGAAYIESLVEQGHAVKVTVAEECAKTIRQKSVARELQKLGQLLTTGNSSDLAKVIAQMNEVADTAKTRLAVSRHVPLTTAAKLRVKLGQQQWLWFGYIPVGQVTLIVSQQGQGKSNVAGDLCDRLAKGTEWPDGTPITGFEPGDRILYLDAEGFLQGLLTRFANWGTPDEPFIWPENCDNKSWALNTPADQQRFESIIAQYRPKFIVIDSLSGANSLEEKDNDQMKTLVQWLVALTQKYNLALVLVHHIRKGGMGELNWPIDLDRVRGASAITQFARVVHAIGTPDSTQPLERIFATIKNNLADFAPALGFRVLFEGLAWGDAPEVPQTFTPKNGAREFLINLLTPVEKMLVNDIMEEAEQHGFKQRTIYRAKDEVGIRISREEGKNGRTFWGLSKRPEEFTV